MVTCQTKRSLWVHRGYTTDFAFPGFLHRTKHQFKHFILITNKVPVLTSRDFQSSVCFATHRMVISLSSCRRSMTTDNWLWALKVGTKLVQYAFFSSGQMSSTRLPIIVLQRRLDTMQARDRRLNTKGLSVRTHYSHPKVQFVLIHSERKPIPKVVANFLPFDCP